jgi:hypothetical protein
VVADEQARLDSSCGNAPRETRVSVDTVAIRRGTQKSTVGNDTRVALLRDGRELLVSRSGYARLQERL